MLDTHFHLYDEAFDPDRGQVVERALESGVTQWILPGIDPGTFEAQLSVAKSFPQQSHLALGLHPESVATNFELMLEQTYSQFATCKKEGFEAVAVGEIGIDGYWSREFIDQQITVFEEQLRWASAMNIPVIIHVRNTFPEILEVLKRNTSLGLRGVLHAFSGSVEIFEQARRYADLKVGIGGVLTYKNSHLAQIVKDIPLSEILLETDAPWLTPVPLRGKRNETSYLKYVAQTLSTIKEISPMEVDLITTANAKELFHI